MAARDNLDDNVIGDYRFIKTLGEGSFGKVKLVQSEVTGNKYACKVLERKRLENPDDMVRAQREIRLLSLLRHPHICQLHEVIEQEKYIFLVIDYCSGGELFDYIVNHKRIREREARVFFRSIISAVDYCHRNYIIHRDLKPENLLLDADLNIKIIDFGFSNTFRGEELLKTFCGSPAYAAPEMVVGKEYTGPQVDIWSLGVILFAITCGHLPFDDPNVNNLYAKIVKGEYQAPAHLSAGCQDLIAKMLVVKAKKRATMDEIFHHPWVTEGFEGPPDNGIPARPPITELNGKVMGDLVAIGFNEEELRTAVLANTDGTLLAAYHLQNEKRMAEERAAAGRIAALQAAAAQKRAGNRRVSGVGLEPIGENNALHTPPTLTPDSRSPRSASPAVPRMVADQAGAVPPKKRRHSVAVGDAVSTTIEQFNLPQVTVGAGASAVPAIPPFNPKARNVIPPLDDGVHPPPSPTQATLQATPPRTPPRTHSPSVESAAAPAGSDADEGSGADAGGPGKKAPAARKRRFSLDAAMSSISNAFTKKKPDAKAKLRIVRGPFSVQTTSSKSPEEMMAEVERVLNENQITFTLSGYQYDCETNLNGAVLRFEVEICKLERLTLNGLRLKRVAGDAWAYKRQCLLLLSQMKM